MRMSYFPKTAEYLLFMKDIMVLVFKKGNLQVNTFDVRNSNTRSYIWPHAYPQTVISTMCNILQKKLDIVGHNRQKKPQ